MSTLSRKITDSYSGEALFQGVPNVQGLPGGHVGECDDDLSFLSDLAKATWESL